MVLRLRSALVALLLALLAPGAAARPSGGALVAFVSAEDDDQLVAVEVHERRVVARLAVADGPHNVAASPNGRWVLVTSPPAGVVTVVDAFRLRIVKRLRGFASPHDVEVSPDSRWAYVTDERRGRVAVVSLTTRRVVHQVAVAAGPHDLAVGPGGRRVWVTHSPREHRLTILDSSRPAKTRPIRTVPSGYRAPHDIAFAPGGATVWVTYWNSGYVGRYHARSGRLGALVAGGQLPHHVAASAEYVWITDHEGDRAVILAPRGRILRKVAIPGHPHHVALAGDFAVAVSHDTGRMHVFTEGGRALRSVHVGRGLHGVALAVTP